MHTISLNLVYTQLKEHVIRWVYIPVSEIKSLKCPDKMSEQAQKTVQTSRIFGLTLRRL